MTHEPLLSVKDLSVRIGMSEILKGISFSLLREEVLAVVGPNGAGKSVLLKSLLGIITPTSGEISWAPGVRIGYLPQRFHVDLYLPMMVREFMNLKPTRAFSNEQVLDLVGIDKEWLGRRLSHLSSGQLQRVLLAWALLDNPAVLFFDEPTENVDIVGQDSIYSLLHHLQDATGVALLIVSHDLHVVYRYANNVLCINQKMLCFGEPEVALTNEKLSELFGEHAYFHHHHSPHGLS